MALVDGIDSNALINAFRAGKQDRYNDDLRGMEMAAKQKSMQDKAQWDNLLGQLYTGGRPPQGGVLEKYAPAKPTFDSAFSPDAMDAIGQGQTPPVASPAMPANVMPALGDPQGSYNSATGVGMGNVNMGVLQAMQFLNPEDGNRILTGLKQMDDLQLAHQSRRNDMMGRVAWFVGQSQDPAEQFARFKQSEPQLAAAGWSAQEIGQAEQLLRNPDPAMRGRVIQGYQALAQDTEKLITEARMQREQDMGKIVTPQPGGGAMRIMPDGQTQWIVMPNEGGHMAGAPVGGHAPVPPDAVAELRADPSAEAKAEFDQIFGPGASASVLGGGSGNAAGNFRP